MKKIWGMDIFRAIAAMLVFGFHFWTLFLVTNTSPEWFFLSAGHIGVDFFFVISGLLVFLSLYRYSNSKKDTNTNIKTFKKYFSARVRRIAPLAIVTTFLFFLLKQDFSGESFLDFFAHLFFLQGFFPDFYHGINPVMWSISIEMAFYLFLPFWYLVLARKKFKKFFLWGIVFLMLSFAYRSGVFFLCENCTAQEKIIFSEQLWGRFDQFLYGIILAVLWIKKDYFFPLLKKYKNIFLVFGFFGILSSFYFFGSLESSFRDFFLLQVFLHSWVGLSFSVFLLWFLLCFGEKNIQIKKWSFKNIPFFLGEISYGIYLFHFPVLSVTKKIFSHSEVLNSLHLFIPFLFAVFITVFLSAVSYYFFEKRFLRRK